MVLDRASLRPAGRRSTVSSTSTSKGWGRACSSGRTPWAPSARMPARMIVSIGAGSLGRGAGALRSPVPALQRPDPVGGGYPLEVAVGAGQALVAQLGLDDLGRQALGGQLDGVGVAQALGVDPLADPGLGRQAG